MKTLTLFNAYQAAETIKRNYVLNRSQHLMREGQRGIAVEKDFWALRWQRRDRQSYKFEQEIRRRLEDERRIIFVGLDEYGTDTVGTFVQYGNVKK